MMKRLVCILLAVLMLNLPVAVFAQEATDSELDMVATSAVKSVEVGDQFLVDIVKSDGEKAFLTFRVNGSFDKDAAELIAPVYTNRRLGVLTNSFGNENGTFTFEGYDQQIKGVKENAICSLLFKAKKSGEFELVLEDCMLGKAGENAFYKLGMIGATVEIVEDTDGEAVSIIEDAKPATPFDDMAGYEWAEKAVGVMVKLEVINDIADKSFYPDKDITRGEFITMLMRICKQKSNKAVEPFGDVEEDSYQYEYVLAAKALGIAKGDENGNFRPDESITRQDVCALVYRTMRRMNKVNPEIDTDKYLADFADKSSIAPYAVECMAGLIRAKLLTGDDNKLLNPAKNMTRAEAAVLLNSLAEFNILVSRG